MVLLVVGLLAIGGIALIASNRQATAECHEDAAMARRPYPEGELRCHAIGELFHMSPVLHVRGQDVTERDLIFAYQSDFYTKPQESYELCLAINDLEVVSILGLMGGFRNPNERVEDGGTVQPRIMAGAIARPGQVGLYPHKLRMAELLQITCRQVFADLRKDVIYD